MQMDHVNVYVTGSNFQMLSTDILTQFRDRGDEIRVYSLSFAESYDLLSPMMHLKATSEEPGKNIIHTAGCQSYFR